MTARIGSTLLLAGAMSLAGSSGCRAPMLAPDGRLVIAADEGKSGVSVLTANGIEFMDRAGAPPAPIARKSVHDPWEPATGFLLPKSGIWRESSDPVVLAGPGLSVVMRSSDALLPSWGGEILLRLDVVVPAEAFPEDAAQSGRPPLRLTLVVDGAGPNTADLAAEALDGLGHADRAAVVHTSPPRVVVPMMPGTHRTLLAAAAERVAQPPGDDRDLSDALDLARRLTGRSKPGSSLRRRVLVISDGLRDQPRHELSATVTKLERRGVQVSAVGASDDLPIGALEALGPRTLAGVEYTQRRAWVARSMPPPGRIVVSDLVVGIASSPAPARIIEPSGGTAALRLESDELSLGDLYVGESRTEVLRVAMPVWVPGEPLELNVTATYGTPNADVRYQARNTLDFSYSADLEKLANRRHGDVIAYASALAMVKRLDRAFVRFDRRRFSSNDDGLHDLVAWQARSMRQMARERHDPALARQAEVLRTLLSALGPDTI